MSGQSNKQRDRQMDRRAGRQIHYFIGPFRLLPGDQKVFPEHLM